MFAFEETTASNAPAALRLSCNSVMMRSGAMCWVWKQRACRASVHFKRSSLISSLFFSPPVRVFCCDGDFPLHWFIVVVFQLECNQDVRVRAEAGVGCEPHHQTFCPSAKSAGTGLEHVIVLSALSAQWGQKHWSSVSPNFYHTAVINWHQTLLFLRNNCFY